MIVTGNILYPLIFALILAISRKHILVTKWLGLLFSIFMVVYNGWVLTLVDTHDYLLTNLGGWDYPYAIILAVDRLSAVMLFISSLVVLLVVIYSWKAIPDTYYKNFFLTFVFLLFMGVNGAFSTADLFNLYVWYEVMIMSSFILITIGNTRQQLTGSIKYVTMNLLSSMFFLAGIGLIYAETGTINMADLAQKLTYSDNVLLINSTAVLFFIGFGIKSAVFPLFYWLPASYHTPPLPITALFSGLLTKVGVYSMLRFFSIVFIHQIDFWQGFFLLIAGLTMVVGVFTAASQYEIRRILSFHIVSQIGFMIMGLALFTPLGLAAAIYYMLHNILAKTNAFLVAGNIEYVSGTFHLKKLGMLIKKHPFLAFMFAIPALALAGFPPISGFIGKFALIKAGLEAEKFIITGVAVIVSFFTLFSMLKIWMEGFWKEKNELGNDLPERNKLPFSRVFPTIIFALATILLGIFAEPAFDFLLKASGQLLDTQGYYEAMKNLN